MYTASAATSPTCVSGLGMRSGWTCKSEHLLRGVSIGNTGSARSLPVLPMCGREAEWHSVILELPVMPFGVWKPLEMTFRSYYATRRVAHFLSVGQPLPDEPFLTLWDFDVSPSLPEIH